MLNCFKGYKKCIHILNRIWDFTQAGQINTANTMPADALATLGAKAGIFRRQH